MKNNKKYNNNQFCKRCFFNVKIFLLVFLIMANLQLAFSNELQGVSVDLITQPQDMQIQINWDTKITSDSKVDVTVTPVSGHCHQGICIEDGINVASGHVVFPKHIPSVANTTPECSIDPDCEYEIKVETQNRQESKNIRFQVPGCTELINSICSCRIPYLPEILVSAKLLNTGNAINITWNLENTENLNKLNVTKIQVISTIHNKTNPSLSWGGRLQLLGIYNFKIDIDLFKSEKHNYNGYKIHKIPPSISLFGSHYLIGGWIIDDKGCVGKRSKYTLIVPTVKTEFHVAPQNYHYHIISIIIPVSIIIIIIVLASNYFYKRFKKSQTVIASSWRSIYTNASSSGEGMHPISMEENLLYLDKDILDAQEKGKADIFEIPHNIITIGDEIGKGAFGRVFRASIRNLHHKPGITIVAVKQLKKRPLPTEIEEFLSEIQMMKSVGHHENVVALIGCCTIKEPYMMIMEYVGHGDLLQYLRSIRKKHMTISSRQSLCTNHDNFNNINSHQSIAIQGKYLELQLSNNSENSYLSQSESNPTSNLRPSVTETMYTMLSQQTKGSSFRSSVSETLDYILDSKELHNFAIQIAKGMKHLEEKGITHRDLAARNVLIDEHKTLKISDFGLSRSGIYVKPKDKARLLPLRWLSIEAIHDNLYSSKSDVWAFGIVLWEIGTLGGFPYPTLSNHELLEFLSTGKRLEKPEICTDFLYKLMIKCWNEDPNKRPSFEEILKSLQSQSQKIYVNFNDLGPDYVFPPIKEEIILNNIDSKLSTPNSN